MNPNSKWKIYRSVVECLPRQYETLSLTRVTAEREGRKDSRQHFDTVLHPLFSKKQPFTLKIELVSLCHSSFLPTEKRFVIDSLKFHLIGTKFNFSSWVTVAVHLTLQFPFFSPVFCFREAEY